MAEDLAPGAASASEEAGARAARSTIVRASSDIAGKLLSFVLFAALARTLDQSAVGIFFFGLALVQLAAVPVDLGLDRLLLRRVSEDRDAARGLLSDVLGVKLALALPVALAVLVAINVLGYAHTTRVVVLILTGAMVVEAMSRPVQAIFMAQERNELLALYSILQRIVSTGLGLLVLALGYGVIAVAATYATGAVAGTIGAFVLLAPRLGGPRARADRSRWVPLARESLPFAVHESATLLLLKLDAVLLSLLATQAAVGRYGVASRLYEATFFVWFAITGAVAPMYVYLTRESAPTVGAVFARSIKLVLVLLVPCSAVLGGLAQPVMTTLFGSGFEVAAPTLRLLAASAALMGVINLCSILISLRMNPTTIVRLTAAMVVLNVAANVLLIPHYGDRAAAGVMTGTLAVFAVFALRVAAGGVGGVRWVPTLLSPLLGGAAMLAVLVAVGGPVLALIAGLAAYVAVVAAVERLIAPDDLRFAATLVRRRLAGRGDPLPD